jgi:hypothetical protein
MADFQKQVSHLVEVFVAQITAVARDAAVNTLNAAIDAANRALQGTRVPGAATPRATPGTRVVAPLPRSARPKGAKRPQAELAVLQAHLADFIRLNPGLRVEELNRKMGTTTKDVANPLRKLIAEGVVRTEGEKRSTQYFATDAVVRGSAAAVAPRRRTRA